MRIPLHMLLGMTMSVALLGAADQWTRHVIATGFPCQTAVAADFTGDGRPDVIVDAHGETHLYVAPSWEKVVIDAKWPFRPGERNTIHSEVLDVDSDGDPDYIGAVYSPGPVFWLERPDDPMRDRWIMRIVDADVNGT
ncbi:MAG: VCBS repeat-containing protein, partial [Bryobacterales bacterium]|nr:VCBS repeat-containing protein [Bryobacterales bacterium]